MSRDPTTSEAYVALRNALLAMQEDASALQSVLSAVSDGGASFIASAYYELRRALVQGRLQEAESVGRLIGAVLDAKHQGAGAAEDEFAENRLHHESMQYLVDGIKAILNQDAATGIAHLERLTEAVYCDESLQWVAWLWMARAAADKGDMELAKDASQAALALAANIDPLARGTTLCTAAEIEFARGESEAALSRLTEATAEFEEIGDQRGRATAGLTLAHMLYDLGRVAEATQAAREAQEADFDWEPPVVFLSERALIRGELEEAKRLLAGFGDESPAPEVSAQLRLVDLVRDGSVAVDVVAAYLRVKERPPAEENLPGLEALWRESPGFVPLRELLAWNLLKLGREEAAAEHFEALARQELAPEVRASVLLGLGCLASKKFGHRQSSARVHAAVAASAGDGQPAAQHERERPTGPRPAAQRARVDSGIHAAMPAGQRAVFTGELQLLAVPDLLEFMKSSRRTGTLVITSERGIGAVHMRNGRITGAASPGCPNMGDLLIRSGALSELQLQAAASYQRAEAKEKLLGTILVERGLVTSQALESALVRQIKSAVAELVEWTAGRFAFEPDSVGQRENDGDVNVELDTEGVLLDVLRELDERNRDSVA